MKGEGPVSAELLKRYFNPYISKEVPDHFWATMASNLNGAISALMPPRFTLHQVLKALDEASDGGKWNHLKPDVLTNYLNALAKKAT